MDRERKDGNKIKRASSGMADVLVHPFMTWRASQLGEQSTSVTPENFEPQNRNM